MPIGKAEKGEPVICRDCQHSTEAFLAGYDGAGLFASGICIESVVNPKAVDLGALRYCGAFLPK